MTVVSILLLIVSAFTHAGWNLFSKSQNSSESFFLLANIAGFVIFSPFLLLHYNTIFNFPTSVWVLLIATGIFHAVYYTSLANAYKSGDISIAYPIARSSPIIVVTFVTLILGQISQISVLCIIGIPLVVVGCFLVPMKRFKDIRLKNYLNATCGFALVAAFGSAGYSIVDDAALKQLRAIQVSEFSKLTMTLAYTSFNALFTAFCLIIPIFIKRIERNNFTDILKLNKKSAISTGFFIFASYALVLISMGFVANISYVVAFRQLSIPVGAFFGITLLKERMTKPKIVGVLVMFIGLILVGTG